MKLINIISGTLICRAIDCYSIPDLILYNEHPQFFQLFPKVFNVKADHTVIQFHVCSVIKYFQRTININFKRKKKSYVVGFSTCSVSLFSLFSCSIRLSSENTYRSNSSDLVSFTSILCLMYASTSNSLRLS